MSPFLLAAVALFPWHSISASASTTSPPRASGDLRAEIRGAVPMCTSRNRLYAILRRHNLVAYNRVLQRYNEGSGGAKSFGWWRVATRRANAAADLRPPPRSLLRRSAARIQFAAS